MTGETDFEYAWQAPDPEPDEGPGPHLARDRRRNYWSGSSGTQPRGTVMLEYIGTLWLAYVRLEDPPGLSPIRYGAAFRRRPAPRGRLRRKSVQRSRRMTGRLG